MNVIIYKLANRLKHKLGIRLNTENPGYIDPEALEKGDTLIEKLCAECPQTIAAHLENLVSKWEEMRTMPESGEREAVAQDIFTLAHEIKDIGSMCGYTLSAFFAESLRDYIAKTELSLRAQQVIIQAHVDALQFVYRQGFKTEEEAGPAAEELKKMVKVAIDKYS